MQNVEHLVLPPPFSGSGALLAGMSKHLTAKVNGCFTLALTKLAASPAQGGSEKFRRATRGKKLGRRSEMFQDLKPQQVPVKPLFLDLAGGMIKPPNLDQYVERKSKLRGLLGGLFGGGKKD